MSTTYLVPVEEIDFDGKSCISFDKERTKGDIVVKDGQTLQEIHERPIAGWELTNASR
jgi:hypothetical protein